MRSSAFSMIELIFVIVVLGILASVALPRLTGSMEQSYIAKAQGDVASIRAGIAGARQKALVRGDNSYPSTLDSGGLFGNVLTYPITKGWSGASPTYQCDIGGVTVQFDYNSTSGVFDCDHSDANCKKIVE